MHGLHGMTLLGLALTRREPPAGVVIERCESRKVYGERAAYDPYWTASLPYARVKTSAQRSQRGGKSTLIRC